MTLSIDDEVLARARRQAEAQGTSVNQLIRQYLEQLAGKRNRNRTRRSSPVFRGSPGAILVAGNSTATKFTSGANGLRE